ncbi:MAG: NAD(P)H-dependent oxidoreductase [Caulobacteraceae bacterium]
MSNTTSKPRIGIILSTTREGRLADKPAAWIADLGAARTDLEFETVDLRDHPLPFFEEVAGPMYVPVKNPVAQRWQQKLSTFDGFIIVTAEYNHGPSAVLKNALDYAGHEWVRKPVAFVGYGGVGAARAIGQLRQTAVQLQLAPVPAAVNIGGADFFAIWQQGKDLADLPHLLPSAHALLDDLAWWTTALKAARESTAQLAAAA